MWTRLALGLAALAVTTASASVAAQNADARHAPDRQTLDDAWWTGPMLANSAGTLPRGHLLAEPYVYDVYARAAFDGRGHRQPGTPSHGLGSLTYFIYGLTDRFAVGLIPTFGYNTGPHGPRSSRIGLGDESVYAQYGLTRFHEGSAMPSTALSLEETFPTGKYDRLGDRPGDGFGSGTYTTTLAFLSQTYFWLPNGRVLRMRFNASHALSSDARVRDVSVYGTDSGFSGSAAPGGASFLDLSLEYSVTRRWVLGTDVTYRHAGGTQLTGWDAVDAGGVERRSAVASRSAASDAFALAPALEYSWSSRAGVLLGARIIAAGRNTPASVTPALAINLVR